MESKEKIIDISIVSTKYQITLTKDVRSKLNAKIGDKILFIEKNGEIIIKKA